MKCSTTQHVTAAMSSLKILALFGVIMAVSWLYFEAAVPDEMSATDKGLLRQYTFAYKLGTTLRSAALAMGFGPVYKINRWIKSTFMDAFIRRDEHDVVSQPFTFDGVPVTVHRKLIQTTHETGSSRLRPALLFISGGGWVYDLKEAFVLLERHFVNELDVVLVSVHYRRAPENPYPDGLNDCLTALRYLYRHSQELGVDPAQISVIGDSAGANLAAAMTLKLRDTGENLLLQGQILICPCLQIATFLTNSYRGNTKYNLFLELEPFFWYMNESADHLSTFLQNSHVTELLTQHQAWAYMSKHHAADHVDGSADEEVARMFAEKIFDPYLFPLMADWLGGLPPALILALEYDIFRDDALAYAERLSEDGTPVRLSRMNGFHGIYGAFEQSDVGGDMIREIVDYLKEVYRKVKTTPVSE